MWVRALLVGAIGVVSMALLACGITLVRDTTGHDWYAVGKLTLTEILIENGFDERAPTEYRTAVGAILTLTRDDLKFNGEALVDQMARDSSRPCWSWSGSRKSGSGRCWKKHSRSASTVG